MNNQTRCIISEMRKDLDGTRAACTRLQFSSDWYDMSTPERKKLALAMRHLLNADNRLTELYHGLVCRS